MFVQKFLKTPSFECVFFPQSFQDPRVNSLEGLKFTWSVLVFSHELLCNSCKEIFLNQQPKRGCWPSIANPRSQENHRDPSLYLIIAHTHMYIQHDVHVSQITYNVTYSISCSLTYNSPAYDRLPLPVTLYPQTSFPESLFLTWDKGLFHPAYILAHLLLIKYRNLTANLYLLN